MSTGSIAVRTVNYLREVRAELRKVTWPSWLDLRKMTALNVVFVFIIGVVIGVMDWIFSIILIDLLGGVFR